MNRKALPLLIFGLLFISQALIAGENPLKKIRQEYISAVLDHAKAPTVYLLFSKISQPDAKIIAYQGALEAILTKTTWNPFTKLSYLNSAQQKLNEAIQQDPNDIEIRCIRFAVMAETPSYLQDQHLLEQDKTFILNHYKEFITLNFPTQLLNELYGSFKRCNLFTEEDLKMIEDKLLGN